SSVLPTPMLPAIARKYPWLTRPASCLSRTCSARSDLTVPSRARVASGVIMGVREKAQLPERTGHLYTRHCEVGGLVRSYARAARDSENDVPHKNPPRVGSPARGESF